MKRKAGESSKEEPLGSDRVPPEWVKAVVNTHYGGFLQFVMEKKIKNSDLDTTQNRLLIPSAFVRANIVPLLHEHEKREANLDGPESDLKKIKNAVPYKDQEGCSKNKKKLGRQHGGLNIELFDREGRESLMVKLVRWDTAATVLKGGGGLMGTDSNKSNKYLKFMACNRFEVDDLVEMWAFRYKKHEQLCFVLGKKELLSTELSL